MTDHSGEAPVVEARIRVDRGDFRLDVDLSVAAGEIVALLGPNGAGKTTTLRAIAGLTALTTGVIRVDGRDWDRPSDRFVAPADRSIGMVFQDYLLFPHMTIRDNVAFGLRARGVTAKQSGKTADHWLDVVGLSTHAASKPGGLSGGQAQRAALARALAIEPRLLLLDEPLAALDAGTRMVIRGELSRHLDRFSGATVMVTHDPLDAMILADRLVVIEAGRIVQSGAPARIAREPHTDYIADLMGLNRYTGSHMDGRVELDGGGVLHVDAAPADRVTVAFPPSATRLRPAPHPDDANPPNAWHATVAGAEQHAHTVRVTLDGPPRLLVDVTAAQFAEWDLRPGARVFCEVAADEIRCYTT
ncbi:molybdate transport system ATP-binding protein [Stackebrandtia endophytica]|uniref:Molybdate transport system ATP-binding protein n=1 Tax=Stackebrandtia endophytica TaxID=1496996 RepID=A0A543AWL0_9ACTN|nr:ATP-binding cassette domain-containing protein [Stackebrandtia endophytica]TQL76968.1 molybdate transport system ATP-binding protein [Stackebrandtia endophytica]